MRKESHAVSKMRPNRRSSEKCENFVQLHDSSTTCCESSLPIFKKVSKDLKFFKQFKHRFVYLYILFILDDNLGRVV